MSWVLTADHKPTADDADERGCIWVMSCGEPQAMSVNWFDSSSSPPPGWDLTAWHPKPKAEKPEPYKPPVEERIEWFACVRKDGSVGTRFRSRSTCEQSLEPGERVAHLREVRDGDPTPEDVAKVREELCAVADWHAGGTASVSVTRLASVSVIRLRNWLKLLRGTP